MNLIKYPGIYFTYNTSIDELKKWINKNKNLIRAIQAKLPKKRHIKRTDKSLYWGQTVWILKQDGVSSWSKMSKIIEGFIQKALREDPNELDYDQAPEPTELEKYYNRFLKSLSSIKS